MRPLLAGAGLGAAVAFACAQPQAPPGGEPDRAPPRVVAVTPEPFATVTDPGTPVTIQFDERISERFEGVQRLADAVVVSPETGRVRAERGRRSIEVRLQGGWRPGLVYRVVVLPVFRDLFNNRRVEPVDLVFSTGAPIPETAIAGFVEDPITGDAIAGARIEAVHRADALRYVAVSDTTGFFSLLHLPAGTYDLMAWQDQDRDREADFSEAHSAMPTTVADADTLLLELGLLPGDTTAARLLTAEALDSTTVRLLFDDYFAVGAVEGDAAVYTLPDSSLFAAGALLHGSRLDSLRAARQAAVDSARAAADSARIAADSLPADSVAAPVDTAAVRRDRPAPAPAARPRAGAPAEPRPSRELIVLLPRALVPGESYVAVVRGVTNIRGIEGGGGSGRFTAPTPPPPPPPPADTAAAPPDTVGGGGAVVPPPPLLP